MPAAWRQVWIDKPYLKKTERLNDVSESSVQSKHLEKFKKNKCVYRELVLDVSVTDVAAMYNLSQQSVNYIMTRALCRKNVDTSLSQGLLPYSRINRGSRKKPIPIQSGSRGKAYVFQNFLDMHPYIKQQLLDTIALDASDAYNGRNLTAKAFHKLFIRLVRASNTPEDDYPLCDTTIARESCRLFLRNQQQLISSRSRK